jgi:hypothetical protein
VLLFLLVDIWISDTSLIRKSLGLKRAPPIQLVREMRTVASSESFSADPFATEAWKLFLTTARRTPDFSKGIKRKHEVENESSTLDHSSGSNAILPRSADFQNRQPNLEDQKTSLENLQSIAQPSTVQSTSTRARADRSMGPLPTPKEYRQSKTMRHTQRSELNKEQEKKCLKIG